MLTVTLQLVVAELTTRAAGAAYPDRHKCVEALGYDPAPLGYDPSYDPAPLGYEPPVVCTHHRGFPPALLDQLAELVVPGSTKRTDNSLSGRKPEGSPAPWDPRAGELLDEICRGALRFEELARVWLRLKPARHGTTDLLERGRAALRALPDLVEWIELRDPEHVFVRGPLISPRHPSRGHRPGEIEAWVRSRHARALTVLGGGEPPARWLWAIPNPIPFEWRERWAWSPICHERMPTTQVTCGHLSCLRAAYAAMGEWAPLWCPHCWARGLMVHPTTGLVTCERCVDEDGEHPEWQSEDWAITAVSSMIRVELGLPR